MIPQQFDHVIHLREDQDTSEWLPNYAGGLNLQDHEYHHGITVYYKREDRVDRIIGTSTYIEYLRYCLEGQRQLPEMARRTTLERLNELYK